MNIALEILASTLGLRLSPEELEWLSMVLMDRAEQKVCEGQSRRHVLAGYRDAWEPVRRDVA